jgi:transcriptional regulator with XRE-family HTH domain
MAGANVQEDRQTYTLAYLRARSGKLTQEQLSELAGLGKLTVHYIENKKRSASIEMTTALAIFDALNRKREELGVEPLKFADINWGLPVQGSGNLPPL